MLSVPIALQFFNLKYCMYEKKKLKTKLTFSYTNMIDYRDHNAVEMWLLMKNVDRCLDPFFSAIVGLQHCWLMIYAPTQSREKETALLGSPYILVSLHQHNNYWSASVGYLHMRTLSGHSH